ncbi:hypothetical protein [Shewanella psychrotolerans]|uniref:hypothetical protein n=1 Tax=Shewanella psychrotolerans TaxID=2864206 RepID=UPI001C65AF62|nr:hypothetical protein [Shewanella psychrotolerans]QYK03143.1 hypothetical protein K0I62_09585 [Shewanella psychrotolerans]
MLNKSAKLLRLAAAMSFVALIPSAIGHGGAKDDNGGHLDRSTRIYHCHTDDCLLPIDAVTSKEYLSIVSFNIQFLGNFKDRDDAALAKLVADNDIVVIQELVAPPYDGTFPDNTSYKPDVEAQRFFEAMASHGFEYVLSEEDTGTNDKIHVNSAATEWFVTFFKPETVQYAPELPKGFLGEDRSNHDNYERVPYATPFTVTATGDDFVLVSVHLQPGTSKKEKARRKEELHTVAQWIDNNDAVEHDFFVLGDMNFKNCAEIAEILPVSLTALNHGENCLMTNTNVNSPRPYDNVVYPVSNASSLYSGGQFEVINLIEEMEDDWAEDFTTPYPGNAPYNHNAFRARYSDHHPVRFKVVLAGDDD